MTSPFFDAANYLARNPDVAAAGYTLATAEQHYLRYGATESLTVASRAPNAWFDAKAYLAAYPDLATHGVTAATALSHYVTYGINENRSPAVNVNPADFSYAAYAAANLDLRTAFGITDTANLTTLQQHQLLGQYLSYGLHEGRSGAASTATGSFFTPPTVPGGGTPPVGPDDHGLDIDGTHVSHIYIGTDATDAFHGIYQTAGATVDGATALGQLGTDTLTVNFAAAGNAHMTLNSIENIVVQLPVASSTLSVTGSGVQAVAVTSSGHAFTYNGEKVGQFNLMDQGNVVANFTGVAGTTDALGLTSAIITSNTFTANGIEQYNISQGVGDALNLHANAVDGSTLAVTLSGGPQDITLFTAGSNALTTVSVNGSAVTSNLTVQLDTSLAATNATLTGGIGNDTLTGKADSLHTTALNGGAGTDILVASAGIDTMTGGLGTDTFRFTGGTALAKMTGSAITSTDSISDLTYGDSDTLTLAGAAVADGAFIGGSAIASMSTGVITFKANFLLDNIGNLAAVVAAIDTDLGANRNVVFNDGISTYFLHTGLSASDSGIVKLVLVGAPTIALTADGSGVHFTPGPGI